MTILQALELANKSAGITTDIQLANLREFQSFMDSFRFDQYPINIVLPFTTQGTDSGPQRKAVLQLQGWILTQVRIDPNDYRSKKMEAEYLQPMRKLAVKFLRNLYNSDIIDPEAQRITDTIRPEYLFLGQLAFGVSYIANVPILESACVDPSIEV